MPQVTESESEQAERNHPRLLSRLRKIQQGHWEVPGQSGPGELISTRKRLH